MVEIEAKLAAATIRVLDDIASLESILDYRVERREAERLDTTYVDTPSGTLQMAAIAVRFRETSRGTELTVKREGVAEGAVRRRPEWTVQVEGKPHFPWRAEGALVEEIAPLRLEEPLVVLIETRIRRRALRLSRGGLVTVEIDLDEVSFASCDGRRSPLTFEVEVEVVDGQESDLQSIVDELCRRHPLVPSRRSKLERALLWAGLAR